MIVFFPGKFHPPHLGHLKTILDLSKKYDKVIVGVSEHLPDDPITTVNKIIEVLNLMFENFDNIEVCRIKGTLIKKKNTKGLPEFDMLLSGNMDVLEWANNLKIDHLFIKRAEGYFFSGTEIRNELQNS
jgi:cytidyltransferase-like protein